MVQLRAVSPADAERFCGRLFAALHCTVSVCHHGVIVLKHYFTVPCVVFQRTAKEDFVLFDGDQAVFIPVFGSAIVATTPGNIKVWGARRRLSACHSWHMTFRVLFLFFLQCTGPADEKTNLKICVQGDEKSVQVPGIVYTSAPYTIPGMCVRAFVGLLL